MVWCKVCGYELGDPTEDLHDPKGISDVANAIGGPVENEETAHIVVRDGDSGWRYFCAELGQVTKLIDHPPGKGEGAGGGQNEGKSKENPQSSIPPQENVYEIPEEKSPEEVLLDVLKAPFLGLEEPQLEEMMDWAQDYNGQIPPDIFEDILGNMKGVQKQSAKLARQKYEVKLNRWVREQTQQNDGPPIGITSHPVPEGREQRGGPQGGMPPPQPGGSTEGKDLEPVTEGEDSEDFSIGGQLSSEDLRQQRRVRRVMRRNDAMDKAVEELVDKAAGQLGLELAGFIGEGREIMMRVLKKKAEKDPDWFIEKAENWDLDILDTVMAPSDARREELADRNRNEVDAEVDEALQRISGDQPEHPPPEHQSETPNTEPPFPEGEGLGDMEPEPEELTEEEQEAFEEHFQEATPEASN